ncbi:YjcZ family sporulation protein [Bacillus thuringiensis]|nr:YjcZ family sporulation protein [Bacillus thuringiensis]MED3068415.1 YjcZ family sporulation protein [Bacillus thuringiensis]
MSLHKQRDKGGDEAGHDNKGGFPSIIVLFIILIVVGVGYSEINF